MKKFILGKKLNMEQIFDENGNVIPVTLVKAGPCFITQIKTKEKDGYNAVQIGFEEVKKLNKPEKGHLKNVNRLLKHLAEFKVEDVSKYKIGDRIDVSIFQKNEKVIVSGFSKGKGFTGVIKRHGFSGLPKTHGTKHEHRSSGSIGATDPGRVFKGTKMAGRMGNKKVTIKGLEIIDIDSKNNILKIKGGIAGSRNSLIRIYA